MSFDFYPLKLYLTRLSIGIPTGVALLANASMWLWLLFEIPHTEEQVFLHYTILFGVDYSGPGWKIFAFPLIGLFIILINTLIGWMLFNRDKFISHLLSVVSIFCQMFLLIATYLLIAINV